MLVHHRTRSSWMATIPSASPKACSGRSPKLINGHTGLEGGPGTRPQVAMCSSRQLSPVLRAHGGEALMAGINSGIAGGYPRNPPAACRGYMTRHLEVLFVLKD